jgi:hypothetical protein
MTFTHSSIDSELRRRKFSHDQTTRSQKRMLLTNLQDGNLIETKEHDDDDYQPQL